VWLMEEYVRIFRIDVWFIPPIDPTITDARMIADVKILVYLHREVT
jgi:hypothetical protein